MRASVGCIFDVGQKNEPNLEHQPPLREIWYHSLEATDITPYRQEGSNLPPKIWGGGSDAKKDFENIFLAAQAPKQKNSHCSAAFLAFALPLTFSALPLTL